MSYSEVLGRIAEALERDAAANEKIVALASEERGLEYQPGPPFCPHCGVFNPAVRQYPGSGGPMADFILVAQCGNCQATFCAIPEGWQTFATPQEAEDALTDKRRAGDNGDS